MMKICTYRPRNPVPGSPLPSQTTVAQTTDSDIEIIGGLSEGLSSLKFSHSFLINLFASF